MHAKCKDHTYKRLEEPEEQVRVELLVDGDVAGVALDPEEGSDPRPPPRLSPSSSRRTSPPAPSRFLWLFLSTFASSQT